MQQLLDKMDLGSFFFLRST